MRSGVQRLLRPVEGLPPAPLTSLLSSIPEGAVIRLAGNNPGRSVEELLMPIVPELGTVLTTLVGDADSVSGWLQLQSADLLTGEIRASPARLDRPASDPENTFDLAFPSSGFKIRIQPQPSSGDQQVWKIEAEGVQGALLKGMRGGR